VLEDKLEETGTQKKEGLNQIQSLATTITTLGRVSVPEDVANAVSFLSGPDSDWVTGQVSRPWLHLSPMGNANTVS